MPRERFSEKVGFALDALDQEGETRAVREVLDLADAAPDMLSALLECEVLLDEFPTVKRQVKAAIAKAEGHRVKGRR